MDSEKERLEKELRFLKESLEAGIISEDEYDKGSMRIEQRLAEIGEDFLEEANEGAPLEPEKEKEEQQETEKEEQEPAEKPKEEELVEEKKEEPQEGPEEKETASSILDEVEKEQETEKEEPKEEEPVEEKKEEPKEEKKPEKMTEEKPKPKPKKTEAKKRKPKSEARDTQKEDKSPTTFNRKNVRIIAIITIIIMVILLMKKAPPMTGLIEEKFKAVCSTDEECISPGKVGICLSPGTKEASCEFHEPLPVGLTIIGDRTCPSCDTARMLSVLRQLFPGLDYEVVDANTQEGRAWINELGIKVLPAYVFDEELNETMKFEKFKRALVKVRDKYVVTPTASGSNYLFSRMSKPYSFDLYVQSDQDTTVLDNSINEVLGLFGDKIYFNKQVVDKSEEDSLRRELAITTYPAYIINNQLKFTGTQAAEIIKNRFCYVNSLPECSTTLSLDVVKTS
jgi:hypothetical protein